MFSVLSRFVPGVLVSLLAGMVAWGIAQLIPGLSALLVAILLGVVWRNTAPVPELLDEGVKFSAKKVLRTGIVLLGFQLSLSQILDLGWGVILLVVLAVVVTFLVTVWLGTKMGIPVAQRVLVASGFSICGAAAVAATESTIKSEQRDVATALALVVAFGTVMIPLLPFLGGLLGLSQYQQGLWIGASVHEVAQVVAAGGTVGATALSVAVTVKLARVLMLAPVIAGLNLYARSTHQDAGGQRRPPLVPLFVLGFIATMLLRTIGVVPEPTLEVLGLAQTLLLASAMFALGLGVHLRSLFAVGLKPIGLGAASTGVILGIGLSGAYILG